MNGKHFPINLEFHIYKWYFLPFEVFATIEKIPSGKCSIFPRVRFTTRAMHFSEYRTRAIIGRSRFEAALVYKPRILGLKNEEFPFLVHKLSVI